MFVRFVVGTDHESPRGLTGVITEARILRRRRPAGCLRNRVVRGNLRLAQYSLTMSAVLTKQLVCRCSILVPRRRRGTSRSNVGHYCTAS